MNITFVTSNKDKLSEAREILQVPIKNIALELDELQELDPVKIADHKAKQAWSQLHKPVIVWDTSVYIDCLNGFPGPLIKWFWKQVGGKKICQLADSFNNRKIYNETILTYYDGKRLKHFRGQFHGTISDKPRGMNGWDWDTIFIPEGYELTYAEMAPEEMVKIRSHRIALEKLRDELVDLEK